VAGRRQMEAWVCAVDLYPGLDQLVGHR
jgi:hypothetical protein